MLAMPGNWVLGVLVQNVWSFAGDDDADDVNQLLLQPIINYNFNKGWYFTSVPVLTATGRPKATTDGPSRSAAVSARS